MIIIIRGTMGAGKTHLVREVIKVLRKQSSFGYKDSVKESIGNKGFLVGHSFFKPPVFVAGPYTEKALCSGADVCFSAGWNEALHQANTTAAEFLMDLIKRKMKYHDHIIMECVKTATWRDRIIDLVNTTQVRLIHLETPLKDCITNYWERRLSKSKPPKDQSKMNKIIADLHKRSRQSSEDLKAELGSRVLFLDRDQALQKVFQILGLNNA